MAWVGVDRYGVIDAAAFAGPVQPGDRVAAAMWANNVTGVVQPVAELAAICAERGVPLHTDAVQAAASLPIDFAGCGAETMALSAHKLHGPKGVGALVARDPARIRAADLGRRPGARPSQRHRERGRRGRLRRGARGGARRARSPPAAARPAGGGRCPS